MRSNYGGDLENKKKVLIFTVYLITINSVLCQNEIDGDYDFDSGSDYTLEKMPVPAQSFALPQDDAEGLVPRVRPLANYASSSFFGSSASSGEIGSFGAASSDFPDRYSVDGNYCLRNCSKNPATRMTCHFRFTLTYEETFSKKYCGDCPKDRSDCFRLGCIPGDGVQRPIVTVNRAMPGPSIRVCEGDTVIVDVDNKLTDPTSIHWHGLHQRKSPFMDGVPFITQCPIQPQQSFRYTFDVPIGGTYFWHSHSGVQRSDGVYGSLIVRKPLEEETHGPVNGRLYDYDLPEHEMVVMDWQNRTTEHVLQDVLNHGAGFRPTNALVNGRGIPHGFFNQPNAKNEPMVPLYEIRIEKGSAYRLRIIGNGITSCPLEMSIENHTMMVIASDGFDIAPITVDSLVIYAGERWDVVLKGNQEIDSYWIKFRGLNFCNANPTRVFQLAVLNYRGIPSGTTPGSLRNHFVTNFRQAKPRRGGRQLNPLNYGPGIHPDYNVTAAELTSLHDDDPEIIRQEEADHKFYLFYDFNPLTNVFIPGPHRPESVAMRGNETYTPQINFISHVPPKAPPLSQPEILDSLFVCNNLDDTFHINHPGPGFSNRKRRKRQVEDGSTNCTAEYCACCHLLKVKHNSIVEIILVDKAQSFTANHPFHLHGHSFRVVALARLHNSTTPEEIKTLDRKNLIQRRRKNAPIKDTVTVPSGGYTIIRFRANNRGFWYFHCHIEFHVEVGMGLIIQVGETSKMPKAPPNFPKCGPRPVEPSTTSTPVPVPIRDQEQGRNLQSEEVHEPERNPSRGPPSSQNSHQNYRAGPGGPWYLRYNNHRLHYWSPPAPPPHPHGLHFI